MQSGLSSSRPPFTSWVNHMERGLWIGFSVGFELGPKLLFKNVQSTTCRTWWCFTKHENRSPNFTFPNSTRVPPVQIHEQRPSFLIARAYCLRAKSDEVQPQGVRLTNNIFSDAVGQEFWSWEIEVRAAPEARARFRNVAPRLLCRWQELGKQRAQTWRHQRTEPRRQSWGPKTTTKLAQSNWRPGRQRTDLCPPGRGRPSRGWARFFFLSFVWLCLAPFTS